MEVIYKGTKYEVPITTPVQLEGARLYNLAMQEVIICTLLGETKTEDGLWSYNMSLEPSDTAVIPQGIYNLELFSHDESNNPFIVAYYENYAKVKESSFTQDYS